MVLKRRKKVDTSSSCLSKNHLSEEALMLKLEVNAKSLECNFFLYDY